MQFNFVIYLHAEMLQNLYLFSFLSRMFIAQISNSLDDVACNRVNEKYK